MTNQPLFQIIADSIRQDILRQELKPGDVLPTIREMAQIWGCAPGTVQRAYQLLSSQQIIVSKPGAGTIIAGTIEQDEASRLRKAALIHQVESFLIEALNKGYSLTELDSSFQMALDRYRKVPQGTPTSQASGMRFAGSHDPAISHLAALLDEVNPNYHLQVSFTGSLDGLIALSRHEAELSGVHLWDRETDTYNVPFVRRLLPGKKIALVRLADRQIGLIASPKVKHLFSSLDDLTNPEAKFINRQAGAGIRVWLDAKLTEMGIPPAQINGYPQEVSTHTELASLIMNNQANVGIGSESCARTFGLSFIPLVREPYDLVIPEEIWETPFASALCQVLSSPEWYQYLNRQDGYDTASTGQIQWVE